jgi:ATP-binding cassette, subfamily B, multidrug efflux pump
MHLLPRFYDVTEGSITIDGQDIREVTLASVREAVAVVQQDSFLFTTSIENNIAYAAPFAEERSIHRVSDSAQLHDYVLGLPQQYGTVVGERGVSLSGGQRQRLSIARTLMMEPAVLIFDDSTAAIDAGTESRIRAALRTYAKDRVTLIVAHRLASLRHADRSSSSRTAALSNAARTRNCAPSTGAWSAASGTSWRPTAGRSGSPSRRCSSSRSRS